MLHLHILNCKIAKNSHHFILDPVRISLQEKGIVKYPTPDAREF